MLKNKPDTALAVVVDVLTDCANTARARKEAGREPLSHYYWYGEMNGRLRQWAIDTGKSPRLLETSRASMAIEAVEKLNQIMHEPDMGDALIQWRALMMALETINNWDNGSTALYRKEGDTAEDLEEVTT